MAEDVVSSKASSLEGLDTINKVVSPKSVDELPISNVADANV